MFIQFNIQSLLSFTEKCAMHFKCLDLWCSCLQTLFSLFIALEIFFWALFVFGRNWKSIHIIIYCPKRCWFFQNLIFELIWKRCWNVTQLKNFLLLIFSSFIFLYFVSVWLVTGMMPQPGRCSCTEGRFFCFVFIFEYFVWFFCEYINQRKCRTSVIFIKYFIILWISLRQTRWCRSS